MFPVLIRVLSRYAPYVTLPIAAIIGVVGYNIEGLFSDKYTPYQQSISEVRKQRLLENDEKSILTDVLDRNLSPSLQEASHK